MESEALRGVSRPISSPSKPFPTAGATLRQGPIWPSGVWGGDRQGQGWQEGKLENGKGGIEAWSAASLVTVPSNQAASEGGERAAFYGSFTAHTSGPSAKVINSHRDWVGAAL